MKTHECPTMKRCRTCKIDKEETDYYPRYATCKACGKAKYGAGQKAYYERNAKKVCKRTNEYYTANKEKYTEGKRIWREDNRTQEAKTRKLWRETNLDKARLKEAVYSSERRAKLKQALPKWANKHEIEKIYAEAQELGWHVDHIVPLSGRNVSGLHWEGNLQVISPHDNHTKSNNFIEDIV